MSCQTCTPTTHVFDSDNPPNGLPDGFDFTDTSLENLEFFYTCVPQCCGDKITSLDGTLLAQHCENGLTTKPTLLKILDYAEAEDPCCFTPHRNCGICEDEHFLVRHRPECCESEAVSGSLHVMPYFCADPELQIFDMTETDGCWTTDPIQLPSGWYKLTILLNDGNYSRVVVKRRIRIR